MKRTRRLSDAEYAQLGTALNGGVLSDIFLFLAVTGFQKRDRLNLRWSELDLERSIVTLGDTKTGVCVRPLSGAAIEIIQRQSAPANMCSIMGTEGRSIVSALIG